MAATGSPPRRRSSARCWRTRTVLVVSAIYFFGKANQTVDENAPADTWFAVSAAAGFASLVLAPALLWTARLHHDNATAWRASS